MQFLRQDCSWKNAVIGISEGDRYLCDYVATEDSVLAVFNCESAEDLKEAIHGQESMRSILLRAALGQRQMLLRTYAGFTNLVRQFHSFAENEYSQYENLCAQYHLDEQSFTRMDNFKPLEMVHRAENWEIGNSASLTGSYLEEYVHLMQRDDNLCIGAIMEASYQTRRVTQGIIEMVEYLRYNQDILLAESKNDLFNLFFALAIQAQKKNYDVKPLLNEMDRIAEVIKSLASTAESWSTCGWKNTADTTSRQKVQRTRRRRHRMARRKNRRKSAVKTAWFIS